MVPTQNYKRFFTEFIRKHMVIFGPQIAHYVAARVAGLTVDPNGEVSEVQGEGTLILEDLVNAYSMLCQPITQINLYTLFEQYPDIKAAYNQPVGKVRLICSLTEQKA
jgi:hypothetical protein